MSTRILIESRDFSDPSEALAALRSVQRTLEQAAEDARALGHVRGIPGTASGETKRSLFQGVYALANQAMRIPAYVKIPEGMYWSVASGLSSAAGRLESMLSIYSSRSGPDSSKLRYAAELVGKSIGVLEHLAAARIPSEPGA